MEHQTTSSSAFARPAAGAGAGDAVISVRGEAAMTVDPELADLTLTVEAHARDRREAFERLVKRNDEIMALLRSYGDSVERIESTSVAVAPELRRGRDEKIRSYSGVVRVRVSVGDLAVLGELVGRAADLDGVAVAGPAWRLRTDSPAYRLARTEAVGQAVARARDYAAALGSRLTGLIELCDTGLSAVPQAGAAPWPNGAVVQAAFAGAPGAGAEPPVLDLEPRQQDVRASVEARFHCTAPDFPVTD